MQQEVLLPGMDLEWNLDWIGLEYLFSPISIIIINLTTGLALWGVYLIVVDCYC